MRKLSKTDLILLLCGFVLPACVAEPLPAPRSAPVPAAEEAPYQPQNISHLVGNVIIAERSAYSITYEYHDVRVDEVAELAAMYCQDHGRSSADLENILLYKNNNRRATFYCRQ